MYTYVHTEPGARSSSLLDSASVQHGPRDHMAVRTAIPEKFFKNLYHIMPIYTHIRGVITCHPLEGEK
jgi:hypothetical protein